jgi:LmbE family N-acetylglucosaminyl deacetylase
MEQGQISRTLVTFHAHPDDESIATGGVMAQAAAAGHRVVLVVATKGEVGEVDPGVLRGGETLEERRVAETRRAAEVLGVSRVEFLGYRDSGMAGTPDNDAPGSFWSADVDEAAARLAVLLEEEHADVLTVYDERGGYDHPDHIQVHRVGIRAAALAGTPRVYESTVNGEYIRALMTERRELLAEGIDMPGGIDSPDPDDFDVGVDSDLITTTVDVRAFVEQKRTALAQHSSQVDETSFFLAMPMDAFREAFGQEWFIRRDKPSDFRETSLFDDLEPKK